MWRTLKEFAGWYWDPAQEDALSQRIRVPSNAVKSLDWLFELVLFREGQYQAEMLVMYAQSEAVPHRHPDVDSMDVHLAGTGQAFIGGRLMPQAALGAAAMSTRRRIVIPRNVVHYGKAETDVVVISLQKWHNDVEPTFITDNWEYMG